MKSAFHIARKDFMQHLRSSRFLLTVLLCLLFVPFVTLTGTGNYHARQTICRQGESIADSLLSDAYVWSQIRPLVVKKTGPLSIFCQGVTPNMGVYNQVLLNVHPLLPHSFSNEDYSMMGPKQLQMQGDTGNNDNVFLNTFSYTDFAGMIGLVFSLLALVFSYDAFSHEKEAGTLQMIFSRPVHRLSFLFGKIGGVCLILIPPVILCYALTVGYLMYAGVPLQASDWNGILLLLLLTFGFIFVCTLLGMLVSLLAHNSEQALTIGFLLWMSMVFILPAVSGYLAETMAPIPLYRNIEAKMKLLDKEYNKRVKKIQKEYYKEEKVKNTMRLFNNMSFDGFVDNWGITKAYARATLRTKAESEPLRITYSNQKWLLQQEYLNGLKRQIRIHHWLTCLSPLQIFQETAQRICRTAPESYLSYMDEVRAYRKKILDFFLENRLFSSYSYFTVQNESEFMTEEEMEEFTTNYKTWSEENKKALLHQIETRPKLDTSKVPRFKQQTGSIQEQGKSCLNAFGYFIVTTFILIYIMMGLSSRYDIR